MDAYWSLKVKSPPQQQEGGQGYLRNRNPRGFRWGFNPYAPVELLISHVYMLNQYNTCVGKCLSSYLLSFPEIPAVPGDRHRNVVMWMDHRAEEQAARMTNTGHGVLARVGGIMSPEMQPPKLLWLKEVRGERGRRCTAALHWPLSMCPIGCCLRKCFPPAAVCCLRSAGTSMICC